MKKEEQMELITQKYNKWVDDFLEKYNNKHFTSNERILLLSVFIYFESYGIHLNMSLIPNVATLTFSYDSDRYEIWLYESFEFASIYNIDRNRMLCVPTYQLTLNNFTEWFKDRTP